MRLINAFELKQRILEERDKIPLTLPGAVYELGIEKPNHHGNAMRGGIRKALRCMEQCHSYTLADSVNQTQRWIPVSERLPEESGQYIVCCDDSGCPYGEGIWYRSGVVVCADVDVGVIGGICWEWREGSTIYDLDGVVTHWMPFPEPPQEE